MWRRILPVKICLGKLCIKVQSSTHDMRKKRRKKKKELVATDWKSFHALLICSHIFIICSLVLVESWPHCINSSRYSWPHFNNLISLKFDYILSINSLILVLLNHGQWNDLVKCGHDLTKTKEQINKSWEQILNLWPLCHQIRSEISE